MWTSVVRRTCAWVPGPLVHRDEPDVARFLDQRLGPVAVMHIPIHDQHPLRAMAASRIVGTDGDAAEETESHCPTAQSMMSRRTHAAEAAQRAAVERHVHGVQYG